MTLYEIDCEIGQLENYIDSMPLDCKNDFLEYTDKMLALLKLKDKRNHKIT